MTKSKIKHLTNCIYTRFDHDLKELVNVNTDKLLIHEYGLYSFTITIKYLCDSLHVSREFVRKNIQPYCRYIYLTANRSYNARYSYQEAFAKLGINYSNPERIYLNNQDVYNWFTSYFDIFAYTKYTPYLKLFKNYHDYFNALLTISDNLVRRNCYFLNDHNTHYVNRFARQPIVFKDNIEDKYQNTVIYQAVKSNPQKPSIKPVFKNIKLYTREPKMLAFKDVVKQPLVNSIYAFVSTAKKLGNSSYSAANFKAVFDNYLILKAKTGNKLLYLQNTMRKTQDYHNPITNHTLNKIKQELRIAYSTNDYLTDEQKNKYLSKLTNTNILRTKLSRLFINSN